MTDITSQMTGPQLIAFVAVAGGMLGATLVALAAIAVPRLASARRAEAAARLKQDLVAAGFSADEIVRVVRATPDSLDPCIS